MAPHSFFSVRRVAVVTAVILCAGAASGCYVYEPSTASLLVPGRSVALDLNDLGRLTLANQIGPEVKRISGVLVSETSDHYVLHVNQISFFNGRTSDWSGEAVSVRADFVNGVLEEKLSASRTALAVAGGIAGVGAIVAAHSLNGSGNTNDTKLPGTTTSFRGIQ
jgi:hypothetical protein